MGIALTDDHRELAEVARGFLTSQKARAAARSLLDAPEEERPPFWQGIVELGWLGLHIDEDHGGSGYGLPELVVVIDELGRAVAPGPFVPTVIASAVIAKDATAEQKSRLASVEDAGRNLRKLVEHPDRGGRYARALLLDTLSYAASLVPEIADSVDAVDAAMRLGYNWKDGPFALIVRVGSAWLTAALLSIGRLGSAGGLAFLTVLAATLFLIRRGLSARIAVLFLRTGGRVGVLALAAGVLRRRLAVGRLLVGTWHTLRLRAAVGLLAVGALLRRRLTSTLLRRVVAVLAARLRAAGLRLLAGSVFPCRVALVRL